MNATESSFMRRFVWLAAAGLFVFHQDCWFWGDRTLLFGFLPIGLAYHALFSILAASLWALAARFAWPDHIESWAGAGDEQPSPPDKGPSA